MLLKLQMCLAFGCFFGQPNKGRCIIILEITFNILLDANMLTQMK